MAVLSKNIDIYTTKYDNLFLGDFYAGLEDVSIKNFCVAYSLTSIINKSTCYKNPEKPSSFNLILTNCPRFFWSSSVLELSLSDFRKMVTTVMEITLRKMEQSKRDYYSNLNEKNIFDNRKFLKVVKPLLSNIIVSDGKVTLVEGEEVIKTDQANPKVLNNFFSDIINDLSEYKGPSD